MEGEDDQGLATSQLTLVQVDLVNPPRDTLFTLTGKNVAGSVKLDELDIISDYSFVSKPKAIHIIVELPRAGKRWVQRVSEILLTALLSVCHFTTYLLSPHLPSRHHQLLVDSSSAVLPTISLSFIATYNAFYFILFLL